jgi:hypothetical protein
MEYLQKVNWHKEMEELFSVDSGGQKDYLEYFQQKTPLDDVFFTSFPSEICKDLSDLEQICKFSGKKLTGKCAEILDLANGNGANLKETLKDDNLKKRKAPSTPVPASSATPTPTTPASSSSPNSTQEDTSYLAKKEHHNYIEKKRRKKINSELDQLKDLNPYCRNASANKLSILHFTCEYIQNLQDSYKKLLETNKSLKEKNDKVQAEIREFQKFILQSDESPNPPRPYPTAAVPPGPGPQPHPNMVCSPQMMNHAPQAGFVQTPQIERNHPLQYHGVSDNQYSPYSEVHTPQFHHPADHNMAFNNSNNGINNGYLNEGYRPPNALQQQQHMKLQMAHQQQQQQLQQLQQRLHSPMPSGNIQVNSIPSSQAPQQTPKRTTWTFTQIPSH